MKYILALFAFAVSVVAAKADATLFTPYIFTGGGNQLVCIANNISNTTVSVKVRIVGLIHNSNENCSLPSGDRDGCQAFRDNESGYCRIIVVGVPAGDGLKYVRGVLFARKTTSAPFTMEGAVQAQ